MVYHGLKYQISSFIDAVYRRGLTTMEKRYEFIKPMEYRGKGPHGLFFTKKELKEIGIDTNDRVKVIICIEED